MKRLILVPVVFMISLCILMGCRPAVPINPDTITYRPLDFSPPQPERVELSNGIILYIMEDHELPLLNVTAVVRTGSIYEPSGKEGLAELTGIVMRTGGTASMTGGVIDAELDFMAGSLSVSIEKDSATASLSVLKEDSERGMKIFSDILMTPAFERKKLREAQDIKIEELRRIYDNPQGMAFREFTRIIYRDNPRGRLSTVSSIEGITRDDCVLFHKRFFFPKNVMIAVTGDITKEEAVVLINRHFASWHHSGDVPSIPLPKVHLKGSVNYLFKDIPQSIVIVGLFAPGKYNPDYHAFEVLDFIVGSGGFRSRIFGTVRNKLGLAYSAGSFYSPRNEFGVFGAYAMTQTETTVKVLSVLQSIMEDVKNKGITDDELFWAQQSIINNFVFSFSSAEKIAIQQLLLEYHDLPRDFLTSYRTRIDSVTTTDLTRVAQTYFRDREATLFVLGNEEKFDKPLSTFGTVREIRRQKPDGGGRNDKP